MFSPIAISFVHLFVKDQRKVEAAMRFKKV